MGGLLTAGIRLVEDLLPYGRVITSLEGFSLSRARALMPACVQYARAERRGRERVEWRRVEWRRKDFEVLRGLGVV